MVDAIRWDATPRLETGKPSPCLRNIAYPCGALILTLRMTNDAQVTRKKMIEEKQRLLADGMLSDEDIAYFMGKYE